jgi:urease accessory protein
MVSRPLCEHDEVEIMKNFRFLSALAVSVLFPTLVAAHPSLTHAIGFTHGFSHPFSGLDHVLTMVLVGILAWQLGGRALWMVPLTFVSVMAAGGALGMMGVAIPFVEAGIALSVIVLGGIIALGVKTPVAAATGMVALFAIFHGHAHGAEMPADAAGVHFALGFMLATAALHGIGIGTGFMIDKTARRYGALVLRMAGCLSVLAGIGLMVAAN